MGRCLHRFPIGYDENRPNDEQAEATPSCPGKGEGRLPEHAEMIDQGRSQKLKGQYNNGEEDCPCVSHGVVAGGNDQHPEDTPRQIYRGNSTYLDRPLTNASNEEDDYDDAANRMIYERAPQAADVIGQRRIDDPGKDRKQAIRKGSKEKHRSTLGLIYPQ